MKETRRSHQLSNVSDRLAEQQKPPGTACREQGEPEVQRAEHARRQSTATFMTVCPQTRAAQGASTTAERPTSPGDHYGMGIGGAGLTVTGWAVVTFWPLLSVTVRVTR
jgi:hypothetical protein